MISLLDGRPENADWLMQAVVIGDDRRSATPASRAPRAKARSSSATASRLSCVAAGTRPAVVGLLLERAPATRASTGSSRRINPDNLASIGVVTKAGFVPDGEYLSPSSGLQLQFAHLIGSVPR